MSDDDDEGEAMGTERGVPCVGMMVVVSENVFANVWTAWRSGEAWEVSDGEGTSIGREGCVAKVTEDDAGMENDGGGRMAGEAWEMSVDD